MGVTFRFAVRTDLGTVRTNNEDSALGSSRLLVLADGMGGHAAGEVASTVATRVFAQLADDGEADMPTKITLAGRSTRSALQQMSDADPLLESMGTTLLAVVSHGEEVTVGHIGDSRVYALRGTSLYQVTTDHTHVQRLVDTGQLTPEKARSHPYRAMLLRSLDDQPGGPDLDVIALQIAPGDRLLLCSDGLSDYVLPDEIGELLATEDLDGAAAALIEAALDAGTRDNVTVVVADVVAENGLADGAADPGTTALVGAVVDPLDVSAIASEALADSLPALAALLLPADDTQAAEPPASDGPGAEDPEGTESPDAATELPDVPAEDPRTARTDAVAEQQDPDVTTDASASTGQAVSSAAVGGTAPADDADPTPEHTSVLPAALASGLLVAVAAALVRFLG